MKTIPESFALAHWLDEYPDDVNYSTILEMIANGDDDIWVIDLIEYEPPEAIIRHIESTKSLFALYAAQAIREAMR